MWTNSLSLEARLKVVGRFAKFCSRFLMVSSRFNLGFSSAAGINKFFGCVYSYA